MFSKDVTNALFANGANTGASANFDMLKRRTAELSTSYQNDDQPLAEAQRISDQMMAAKQRRPMSFEWEDKPGQWVKVTMYINPQRLSVQTQKLKSKAVTRGGIFYHHWGDDHWTMSLSGTTGLAGMKVIESLEKAYRASGTLLKYEYRLSGPEIEVGSYNTIDYNDSLAVLTAATKTVNPTTLGQIKAKQNEANGNLSKITGKLLDVIETNIDAQVKLDKLAIIDDQIEDYLSKAKKTRVPTSSEYYNNVLSIVRKVLGSQATSDVVVAIAYQKTMQQYSNKTDDIYNLLYKADNQSQSNTNVDKAFNTALKDSLAGSSSWEEKVTSTLEDMEGRAIYLADARTQALRNHLSEIADWNQRENEIKSQLKGTFESTDLFGDEWAPRRIVMYYENRAFIGHFDAFNYQRSADTPLIMYEMRFTVEKTIVGTML